MNALQAASSQSSLNIASLDDPVVTDFTASFTGQRSFGSSDQLAATEFREGINIDTRNAYACTRRGSQQLGANLGSQVQGSWWYSTPAFGYLVAVAGGALLKYDETSWAAWSAYAATDSTRQVCLAQLINTLYLADGAANLMSWDGTTLTDLGNNASDGTKPPIGSIIITDVFRMWMAGVSTVPDQLSCSLLGDPATWDATYLSIRVGNGDGDPITGLAAWTNNQIVVFKRNSVYIVAANPSNTGGGSSGSLSNATITKLSDTIGCVSHRSISIVGTDVWFLSDFGVTSVGLVFAQAQSEIKVPLSLPIQDLIDRINWPFAFTAASFFWNNRFLLAVPLDEDTSPTTILVYNTQRQGWSGTWTQMEPVCWALSKAGGNERLNFGRQDGAVYRWLDYVLLNQEIRSTFQDNGLDIASSVRSRALIFSDAVFSKSPFTVTPEFVDSLDAATVSVNFDESGDQLVENALPTTGAPLYLPFTLPATLPNNGVFRQQLALQQFPEFRSMEVVVSATVGKISTRAIVATSFINTLEEAH